MDEITTDVVFADHTGHSALTLTKEETINLVESNQGHWVYRNNQMVQANDLANADWNDVGTIHIMPGLTGGY
jgi:hypothetical protein